MNLGRCPSNIFITRGTPPREVNEIRMGHALDNQYKLCESPVLIKDAPDVTRGIARCPNAPNWRPHHSYNVERHTAGF